MAKEQQSTHAIQTDAFAEFTTPVIKLILALLGLFVIQSILTNLPGLDTTFPNTTLTVAAVVDGVITLIMAAIIVNFAQEVEPRVERVITGPEDVVHDIANTVKLLIIFVAILLVYNGLNNVVIPALITARDVWIYDTVFLALALVPTVIIAYRIFDNLDDVAELITTQMQSMTDSSSQLACPECGESVDDSLEFCPSCGTSLPVDTETTTETENDIESETGSSETSGDEEPEGTVCPECEADIDESMAFCGQCGTEVPS